MIQDDPGGRDQQLLAREPGLGEGLELEAQAVNEVGEHGGEHLFLVLEVEEQGAFGHAGLMRDVVEHDILEAALDEHAPRGGEYQALLRIGVADDGSHGGHGLRDPYIND